MSCIRGVVASSGKASVSHHPIGHWRRVATAGIAVVLLAFVFEVAEHSVHHLDDDDAAAECWAASAATHTPTTAPPVVALIPELPVVFQVVVGIGLTAPACPLLGADHERAPPSALSA